MPALLLALTLWLSMAACKTPDLDQAAPMSTLASAPKGGPQMCAAIRGNAHYLFAHFGALARLVEHYGPMHGLAGGSSATMTMFLYESIHKNPYVLAYPEGPSRDMRIALLLKSFVGHLEVLMAGPEAMAVRTLAPIYQKARERGVFALGFHDYKSVATALLDIFNSPDLGSMVDPEVRLMLTNRDQLGYASYAYKVMEVRKAVESLATFRAEDQKLFFRHGVVNFAKMAEVVGRLAQFNAGYQPVDGPAMQEFLRLCGGEEGRGKTWSGIKALSFAGKSCGARYHELYQGFLKRYVGFEADYFNRIDEPAGRSLPVIAATAIIQGETEVAQYKQALARYRQGEEPAWRLAFSSLKYGYWVPRSHADIMFKNLAQNQDAKSQKAVDLGSATWRTILEVSPAEPGLAAAVPLADGARISLGGWPDLAPVQALQAIGCREVVYITRESAETPFIVQPQPINATRAPSGVAEQLNMTEAERSSLYELKNPRSSYAEALSKAQAIWCTDWNRFKDSEFEAMFDEAYQARMVALSPYFERGATAYPRRTREAIVGCHHP